ncbi:MAG: GxxExxY protein [Bacteroidales bacterium]|nr:GxxExxY protein [Bacteroidales bacterium]
MNDFEKKVIGCALEVHKALGPGLLENCYEACLEHELQLNGFKVERQKVLPVHYKGITVDSGYKIDLLVNDTLVLELKAVSELDDVHLAQTLTYLRLGNYHKGLLINFNVNLLKNGIRSVVN